jgi:hypothetical protein
VPRSRLISASSWASPLLQVLGLKPVLVVAEVGSVGAGETHRTSAPVIGDGKPEPGGLRHRLCA